MPPLRVDQFILFLPSCSLIMLLLIFFLIGHVWKRSDILMDKEIDDKFIDVDHNHKDPQLCASIACDIYKHLRMAEVILLSMQKFVPVFLFI